MANTFTTSVTFNHEIHSLTVEERASIIGYICNHHVHAIALGLKPNQIAIVRAIPNGNNRRIVNVEWYPV